MATRSEVYSWRLSPELKAALEDAARQEGVSLARLLERAARAWLGERRAALGQDQAAQARVRAEAMRHVGAFRSGEQQLSTNVRQRVRASLLRTHGR